MGKRIKEAREEAELTQAALAELLGVAAQTVQRWESGKTAISAGRLADLALVTGVRLERLAAKGKAPQDDTDELMRAKGYSWGHVVITFKGMAPSIVRALSRGGYEHFRQYCFGRRHFFSFIDMSGRLIIVNRQEVERLMVLEGLDDRNPHDLLNAAMDRPPSNPLADLFGSDGVDFCTDHELDRALMLAAEVFIYCDDTWDGDGLTRDALLAAEAEQDSEEHSQEEVLAEAVAEVGVLRLERIGGLLEKVENPYDVLERVGGAKVDVHLKRGMTRTVYLPDEVHETLLIAGDELEQYAETDMRNDNLWSCDDGLVEVFDWRDIAWVEGSALHASEASERGLKAMEEDGEAEEDLDV